MINKIGRAFYSQNTSSPHRCAVTTILLATHGNERDHLFNVMLYHFKCDTQLQFILPTTHSSLHTLTVHSDGHKQKEPALNPPLSSVS